jgi:hypothetical protein
MRAYHYTEHTDRLIRQAYASLEFGKKHRPAMRAVCKTLGWPTHVVYRRALKLGIAQPRTKIPDWTRKELDLLEQHAHKTPLVIGRILRNHGFERSPSAIAQRVCKHLGSVKQLRLDAGLMTARAASFVLGVSDGTICDWIARGWLPAVRRGTARTAAQKGDEWVISDTALRTFVIDYTAHVPFQRADKYWLVELLAGSSHGAKQKCQTAA